VDEASFVTAENFYNMQFISLEVRLVLVFFLFICRTFLIVTS
jgi:hypothetical protein